MSRMPLVPWSLVVAALLVPAALHAQAETDSVSSTSAHHARDAGPGVETGHVDTAAQDAGQAGIRRIPPEGEGEAALHPVLAL